jgi:hypothetical protein
MSRNVSHEAPALVNLKHETLQLLRYPSLTISKMPKVNQSEINLDPLDASWCKSLDREEELLPLSAKALRIAVPWPANATQDTQESTVFMVSNARKCGSVPFSDFFEIDWSFKTGLQICVNCRSRHLYSLMSSCNQTQEQLGATCRSTSIKHPSKELAGFTHLDSDFTLTWSEPSASTESLHQKSPAASHASESKEEQSCKTL